MVSKITLFFAALSLFVALTAATAPKKPTLAADKTSINVGDTSVATCTKDTTDTVKVGFTFQLAGQDIVSGSGGFTVAAGKLTFIPTAAGTSDITCILFDTAKTTDKSPASDKVSITTAAAAGGGSGAKPTAKATLVGAPKLVGTGPWTLSVEEGKEVKLTASVVTATEYVWLKAGTEITGKTTKDLEFKKIAKGDAAVYTVKGKNAGGEGPESEKVTITVTEAKDNGAGTFGLSVALSVVFAFAAYLTK